VKRIVSRQITDKDITTIIRYVT